MLDELSQILMLPINKYNSDDFKSNHYRESINPIYDYLGNAQDMYWDFKSVNN